MGTIGNSSIQESEGYSHEHSNLTVEKPSELNTLLTIVIPTFNEQEAIGKVLDELFSIDLKNILVVDGYSSDGTVRVAKKFGVKVIFQQGTGKTGALKTATDHVETPYMLIMDGDYTYDPSYINRFISRMDSYDEIIGARFASDKRSMTLFTNLGAS